MPVRSVYLPDDLDDAVTVEAAERGDDENRSNVIQDALRAYDGVDA